MVPITLVKEFQPITHQYNNNNQSETIQRKKSLFGIDCNDDKWHERKNKFETSNLDIKKNTICFLEHKCSNWLSRLMML